MAALLAGGVVLGLSIDPLFKLVVNGTNQCVATGTMSDASDEEIPELGAALARPRRWPCHRAGQAFT
jgi:hypothetical protein